MMLLGSWIVVVAMVGMVALWAAFMAWGVTSGQCRGLDEMRRLALKDDADVGS